MSRALHDADDVAPSEARWPSASTLPKRLNAGPRAGTVPGEPEPPFRSIPTE
jgi:hypothetical protein